VQDAGLQFGGRVGLHGDHDVIGQPPPLGRRGLRRLARVRRDHDAAGQAPRAVLVHQGGKHEARRGNGRQRLRHDKLGRLVQRVDAVEGQQDGEFRHLLQLLEERGQHAAGLHRVGRAKRDQIKQRGRGRRRRGDVEEGVQLARRGVIVGVAHQRRHDIVVARHAIVAAQLDLHQATGDRQGQGSKTGKGKATETNIINNMTEDDVNNIIKFKQEHGKKKDWALATKTNNIKHITEDDMNNITKDKNMQKDREMECPPVVVVGGWWGRAPV
jgi:hypothetical protein